MSSPGAERFGPLREKLLLLFRAATFPLGTAFDSHSRENPRTNDAVKSGPSGGIGG